MDLIIIFERQQQGISLIAGISGRLPTLSSKIVLSCFDIRICIYLFIFPA